MFLIAAYGAVLSTINWRKSNQKARRRMNIALSTMMPASPDALGRCFVKLEATNIGHRPVNVTTLALELANGKRLFPTLFSGVPWVEDTRLPAVLSDGESAFFVMAYSDVGKSLLTNGLDEKVNIIPICVDSTGGVHRGKPWNVDPYEFSRM